MTKSDSLKNLLEKSKGEERFRILNELFKLNNASQYQAALKYADRYQYEAMTIGDSTKIIQGGRMRAYTLMDLGRNEEALKILATTLAIARRNEKTNAEIKSQIKFILNNAGLASMYLGKYDEALKYHFQSLVIREEEKDQKGIRNSLNNIGLVYFNLSDFEKALQNYLLALDISKQIKDMTGMERVYSNLGLCYDNLGDYSKAVEAFNEGFSLCGENCSENIIKEGLQGLAIAYLNQEEFEEAKKNFLKSLEIARKQNDNKYTCENLYFLSQLYQESDSKKALTYLKEAEQLSESFKFAESRLSIYREFSKIYNDQNDLKNSNLYQKKYISLKDSIYSEKLIKNLTKVQSDYAERENIKTIAAKDEVLVLQKDLIQKQRRQYIFVVVIACLIVALAAMMFYFSKRQQKVNQELSEAKNKIEEQNLQLSDSNKELEMKVSERTKDLHLTNESLKRVNDELDNFIYKTSHDIRGPLATLKGMCNLAMVDVKDDLALGYLKKMDFTADRLNTILTRLTIVNYINNSVLAPTVIPFRDIIDEILNLEKKKGIPDRFSTTHFIEPGSILISDRDLVKLVLENLIDNAIKFYNNSDRVNPFVNITVSREDGFIKIGVEDNGIGILNKSEDEIFQMFVRASERSESGGVGLYLAKLATEKIGGVISMERSTDKGSLFQVLLPEDINMITDPKSAQAIKIQQKIADLRLKKKNFPSLSNS